MVIKIVNQKILFVSGLLIYLFIFVLPTILYLKLRDKVNPLEFLKLNQNIKSGILKGLSISILFLILLIIKKSVLYGFKSINFNIGILWISGLTVGIFEEIPFRGFLLQKLMKRMRFIKSNLITSILFTSIHIPIWLFSGTNIFNSINTLIIVSFILGYLFKESDSLWVPIICHSVFNLSIWIGVG
ncbi:MAG: CPBP family intramembrane metalloprotease [Bacillota bacterium]|nr:CPBP family intramembrane metalloprotease [Bacillota bacterium]